MSAKSELAKKRFTEGFHCSQAVLEAFAEDYDLDPIVCRKLAAPFAGGSGLGGECGAVTGAFMVLGLKHGMTDPEQHDAFMTTLTKVGTFSDKFKALHGKINCIELIDLDVFNEKDLNEFREKNIKLTQCINYVEDAVKIAEEILNEQE